VSTLVVGVLLWALQLPASATTPIDDVAPAAQTLGPGWIPAELANIAREVRGLPLAERMAAVSEALLDLPYLDDPAGEGAAADLDPLARYDAFDCLTFVEEVLALTLPLDPVSAGEVRSSLRYGGRAATYAHRRHFMELQWLPEAEANGWIKATTSTYGHTQHLEQLVSADTWTHWKDRARFAMPDDALPTGMMSLDVLPLEAAIERTDEIRPGSIIMTVRAPRAGVPIWITHLGLVLEGEAPVLRHASRMASARRVRDHDLRWYLEHLRTYVNWPVAGVAIFEPVEVGPRTASPVVSSP
jgi:hypothetical protein